MAAPNSSKVRIAGSGAIWKAPLGTTLPTDSITAWGAGFLNLGYMADGFTVAQSLSTKDVQGWQSLESLRTIATSLIRKFTFDSIQTDKETLALAWGGGTVTSNPATLGTVTIAITTGVLTVSAAHGLVVGDPAQLGTMTAGGPLVAATTYYVQSVPSTTTLTLALTSGGASIVTSASGSSLSIVKMGPYVMAIPNAANLLDFILGFDVTDGVTSQRFIVQRAHQTALPTIKLGRQQEISFTIEVEALAPADGTNSVLIYGLDTAVGA